MSKVGFHLFAAICNGALIIALSAASCGSPSTPLDAATRSRIDSIANAQIAHTQMEYDSLCKKAQMTQLPHLVDSIKKVRVREIQEQLKTVPK